MKQFLTLDVPVTNCSSLAMSSLLNALTTSQNHWMTGDAAEYPIYSVLTFRSSTGREKNTIRRKEINNVCNKMMNYSRQMKSTHGQFQEDH